MGNRWTHFSEEEVAGLDEDFIELLDRARSISGVPYLINSGFRTSQKNALIGGVKDSSHVKGLAVDLKAKDSYARHQILKGLFSVGFVRFVIYPNHIHVDNDISKPQNVFALGDYK